MQQPGCMQSECKCVRDLHNSPQDFSLFRMVLRWTSHSAYARYDRSVVIYYWKVLCVNFDTRNSLEKKKEKGNGTEEEREEPAARMPKEMRLRTPSYIRYTYERNETPPPSLSHFSRQECTGLAWRLAHRNFLKCARYSVMVHVIMRRRNPR